MEILPSNREQLNKSLEAPALDPVWLQIANESVAGATPFEIAQNLGLTEDRVVQVLEKKEVRAYVDNVVYSQGYFNQAKMVETINTVIAKKMEEALESGHFSKKDLHDWLKLVNEIRASARPKERGPQVAVQVNNNYDRLMEDLRGD